MIEKTGSRSARADEHRRGREEVQGATRDFRKDCEDVA